MSLKRAIRPEEPLAKAPSGLMPTEFSQPLPNEWIESRSRPVTDNCPVLAFQLSCRMMHAPL